jgi:hypothetical protein
MIGEPLSGRGQASRWGRVTSGTIVNRSLLASIALSLALLAVVVPAVLGADPAPSGSFAPTTPTPGESATPSDPAPGESATPSDPTPGESATPPDNGTPPDGDISVDPTFITAPPSGAVRGTTGTPDPTLPPTDAVTTTATPGGATLQALLIALAASATLVLLAGRLPVVRRR